MSTVAIRAQDADTETPDEYRVTLFPYHNIKDNLTGFGYLGYVTNEDHDYQTYYVGRPGVNYIVNQSLQCGAASSPFTPTTRTPPTASNCGPSSGPSFS